MIKGENMSVTFEVTDEQEKKIEEWREKLKPKILDELRKELGNQFDVLTEKGELPYYGAIGGGLEYIFIPTGLGTITKVRECITKEEIDLTDYDNW